MNSFRRLISVLISPQAWATFYSMRIPGPTSAQVKAKLESHLHTENCYRTECKRQRSQVPPNLASSKGSGVPRHPGLTPPGTWSLAPVRCLPRTFLSSPPLPLLTWALYHQHHSGLRFRIRFWICYLINFRFQLHTEGSDSAAKCGRITYTHKLNFRHNGFETISSCLNVQETVNLVDQKEDFTILKHCRGFVLRKICKLRQVASQLGEN